MSGSSGILPQLAWARRALQGLWEGRTRGRDRTFPGAELVSRAAALRPRGRGIRDLGRIFGGRAVGEAERTGQLPRTAYLGNFRPAALPRDGNPAAKWIVSQRPTTGSVCAPLSAAWSLLELDDPRRGAGFRSIMNSYMRWTVRGIWPHLKTPAWAWVMLLVLIPAVATSQHKGTDTQLRNYVKGLSGKTWQERASAARSLAGAGPAAAEAVPALLVATRDRSSGVRQSAATAVGEILHGSADDKIIADAVKELLARCNDRADVRSAAGSAVLRIGPNVTAALIGVLRSGGDSATRRFAAELLSGSEDVAVGQAASLTSLLSDADNEVRLRSAAAMSRGVEQCALRGASCVQYLSDVRNIEKALLAAGATLRPYSTAVSVCRRYLEVLGPITNKSALVSFLESKAQLLAASSLILLIIALASSAVAAKLAVVKRRLGEKILEISRSQALQEQNEIARSVLKRFVMMPEREERQGFTIASAFNDASDVSGDFYNWFSRNDGSVCVYLVDVEGSGIDAAIQATHAAKVLERTLTRGDIQKAEVLLQTADRNMHRELSQPNIAVTMNLVEIYPRRVRLANAGMPAPLLFRRGQAQPHQLQAAGVYVGGGYSRFSVEPRFDETTVTDGDLLILISDGVLEACDDRGTIFGRPGIESAVAHARDSEPDVIAKGILAAAAKHSGGLRPADDQTVVVVRFGHLNPPSVGAQTLIEVSFDESDAEFTLTNAIDSAQVCHSVLQKRVREWVDRLNGHSSGRIWCAIWELAKNAVAHGSNRGEVISVKLRSTKDEVVVEVEQPAEWRGWDEFLGDARKKKLSECADEDMGSLLMGDHLGTASLLRLADAVTASMLGRRLTLVFRCTGATPARM